MHTKAKYTSTVSLADVIALLLPKLEVEYDAELSVEDIELVYSKSAETFTISLDLDWDTDFSESDENEDFEFEVKLSFSNRVWASDLNKATDNDRNKWPKLRQQVTLIYRDGSSAVGTVDRIDDDGELFVLFDDEEDYRTVTNYSGDDVDDDDYYVTEVEFIRWSSPKT